MDEESAVALGRRTDKLFRAIKNDIAGWTPQLRDRKIEQLASVIAAMNRAQGPDLLGVCDVENRFVVDQLVDKVNATLSAPRSYAVVHADTDDARGIDVALIYDATLLQVLLPLEGSVLADRWRARWQFLLRQPAQHARPVPGQQEHSPATFPSR